MHENQTVMKAHSQLVGRVGVVLDPIPGVVDDPPKLGLNAIGRYTEITFGRTVISRPSPNPIEHTAMETSEESFVEDSSLAGKRPTIGLGDVLLFEFVEFAAQRDMRRDKRIEVRRGQRRGVIIGMEEVRHFSSQRRAGRRNSSSIRWRSMSLPTCLLVTAWSSRRMVCSISASWRAATVSARSRTLSASGRSGTSA